jgi:molecular chaperone DnaJ
MTKGQVETHQASDDPAPAAVRTVQHRVKLTLEETASGCIRVLQGSVVSSCAACVGTGQAQKQQDCTSCAGKGRIHERTWFGWYGVAMPCADCDGTGAVRPVCPACEGRGKNEVTRYRVSVRLPAHVRDGDVLHVAPARTRAAVALDIHVEVLPHACLVRDDVDGSVRCEFAVDGFSWIANRTVDVPTPRGLQPLQLQRGQVMYRLAGQGFPPRSGGKLADQIVIIVPRFPTQLSREQQRLLDRLAATTADKRSS